MQDDYERPCWVYLVRDGGLVKVGLTENPTDARFNRLQSAYGPLTKMARVHCLNGGLLERRMLHKYKPINVHREKGKTGYIEWHYADLFTGWGIIVLLYWQWLKINTRLTYLGWLPILLLASILLALVWL